MWSLLGAGNFYVCAYICTYIQTLTSPSPPPLNILIILLDIMNCSLSINIESFPSEFRISTISDSNLFFLGFIPVSLCQMLLMSSESLDLYPGYMYVFIIVPNNLAVRVCYSGNFMSTMIFFIEFYKYELIVIAST